MTERAEPIASRRTLVPARGVAVSGPPLPREHGAWVMLLAPMVIVFLGAPVRYPLAGILLLPAATSAFCLQHAAGVMLRRRRIDQSARWAIGYGLLLLGSGLPLLLWYRLPGLLPLAALGAGLCGLNTWLSLRRSRRRFDRTPVGETLGVIALTSTGPAASIVAHGRLETGAWVLWAAVVLYFTSGIFFVNLLLAAARCKTDLDARARWRLGRGHLLYHALLTALVGYAVAGMAQPAGFFFLLAYTPILVRAFRGWLTLNRRPPSLKRVGMGELFYALWFAGCWIAGLRLR